MTESAVINASPLVFLSRGRYLDLLRHFTKRVLVPEPVAFEIRQKGPDDISAKSLAGIPWIAVVPAPTVPQPILEWGLGPGESSVLALAFQNRGIDAIIDDLAARKCAASLGIPVRGTPGIVLAAKRQ